MGVWHRHEHKDEIRTRILQGVSGFLGVQHEDAHPQHKPMADIL